MSSHDDDLTSPEIRHMVDDTVERLRRQARIFSPLRFGKERPPSAVAERLETIRRIIEAPNRKPSNPGEIHHHRRSTD